MQFIFQKVTPKLARVLLPSVALQNSSVQFFAQTSMRLSVSARRLNFEFHLAAPFRRIRDGAINFLDISDIDGTGGARRFPRLFSRRDSHN